MNVVLVGAKRTAKWSPPFIFFTKTILLFSTDDSKDIYVTKYVFQINASLLNFLSVKLLWKMFHEFFFPKDHVTLKNGVMMLKIQPIKRKKNYI